MVEAILFSNWVGVLPLSGNQEINGIEFKSSNSHCRKRKEFVNILLKSKWVKAREATYYVKYVLELELENMELISDTAPCQLYKLGKLFCLFNFFFHQ